MNRSPLYSLILASFRESMRNKVELFFNLFFPLLFLLIFGSLQRGDDNYRKTWMGLFQSSGQDVESVLKQSGVWEPKLFNSEQQLQDAIQKGELNLGLSFDGSHARFFYKDGDLRTQSKLRLAQLSITAALEKQINQIAPVISSTRIEVTAGKMMASGLDYTLAGIIAIAILSTGMMSVVSMFGRYRKSGVLNQLKIAPLKPLAFILGTTFTRIVLSFFSLLLILGASIIILKASFIINWPLLAITMISSTLGMMAVGLLLNLIFRNPETANTSAGILMFLMYFLAGVFFPVALLPNYMKLVSSLLPLKYVSTLVRHCLGLELIPGNQFAIISISLTLGGLLMLWLVGRKFLRSTRD